MISGKVESISYCVMASMHDQPTSTSGWFYPLPQERFDDAKEALERFNQLIADPEILKAEVIWYLSYNEGSEGSNLSYGNCFTIASYDHKAICFEHYASGNYFWKSNEGRYPGIISRYHDEIPKEGKRKSYKLPQPSPKKK